MSGRFSFRIKQERIRFTPNKRQEECDLCNCMVRETRLNSHRYKVHNLAECRFCGNEVYREDYNNHIKTAHGKKPKTKKKTKPQVGVKK